MKIKRFVCFVMAMILLCLVGCSSTPTDPTSELPSERPSADESPDTSQQPSANPTPDSSTEGSTSQTEGISMEKSYSILFIGNSYTYYNDMPTAIFEKIAEAAGYDVEVTAITKGAYTLHQFADPSDTYGAQVEAALSGSKTYDFVILQEQSVRPATEDAPDFYASVRDLVERIERTGATPILYSTWGRKAGNSTLDTYGWTNESMTWKLAAAYQAIGDELDIAVSHVGLSFFDVYTNRGAIELYDGDKTHPSYVGSYLAAMTLFATIFEWNPTKVEYRGDLSEEQAAILCEAARKAAFDRFSIPDAYRTSAKGVG